MFHTEVWKVSLEEFKVWKVKSWASSLNGPGHSDGRDRDKVETEHVRLSTQKW